MKILPGIQKRVERAKELGCSFFLRPRLISMAVWPSDVDDDHRKLKYTEVQSQQIAFTQSPSLSNNPKTLNNYLMFAVLSNTL